MIFDNKGILFTIKLDDSQVKSITELFLGFVKKARDDIDSDLGEMEEEIKKLSDRIERLSR